MSARCERNDRGPSRGPSPEKYRGSHNSHRSREHSPERMRTSPRPYLSPPNSQSSSRREPSPLPAHSSHALHHRKSFSTRSRWPPAPIVEDFNTATQEIHGLTLDLDNPPNRGTLEQESLLVDAYPTTNRPVTPLTKTSKKYDARDWTYKRDSKFESERHFTPTASDISIASTAESGYHSSEKSIPRKGYNDSNLSDGWLESGRHDPWNRTTKSAYPQNGIQSAAVSDDEDDSVVSSHGSRTPAKYAGAGSGQREVFSRETPKQDEKALMPDGRVYDSNAARRSTENPSSSSRPRFDDVPRAFVPTKKGSPAPASRSHLPENALFSTYPSGSLSRPSSPTMNSPNGTPSPPRSPRHSRPESPAPKSTRSSASGGSRPSSPNSNNPSRRDEPVRRAATFPVVIDDRTQKTSRLATSSMTIDQLESPVAAPSRPVLPYPMDDMLVMPSEADHAYKPRDITDPRVPRLYGDGNRMQRSARPPSLEVQPNRPKINSRNTYDGTSPVVAGSPIVDLLTPKTPRSTPRTPKGYTACLGLPGKKDYQEWYRLPDTSVVNICPFCVESKLQKTPYATKVEKTDKSKPDPDIRCVFTSKWHHLAWDITQSDREDGLHLLASIARIDRDARREKDEKPCPGKTSKAGKWMVPRSRPGETPIPFFICSADARKLVKLLPELKGEFEEIVTRHREVCTLHEESHRFEKFTKLLVAADTDAHRKKRRPDMGAFIQLAQILSQTVPCERDNFLRDARWHFPSAVPDLTICSECFSTIVWPEIAAASSVAKRIATTEQAHPREHDIGHSCQLWSPRMMNVFRAAVKNNDFKYLADEAEKRAVVERNLKKEWLHLDEVERGLLGRKQAGSVDLEVQLWDVQRAKHDLAAEWRRYE